MAEFLVEMYVARSASSPHAPTPQEVSDVADQVSRKGPPVRLIDSVLVPDDETRFLLFSAHSDAAVREVAERSGIRCERLVEAVREWTCPQAVTGRCIDLTEDGAEHP